MRSSTHELPAAVPLPRHGRLCAAVLLAAPLALGLAGTATPARAAEKQRSILLLPVASGTPGQEQTARAIGLVLEEWLGSLPGARIVVGAAREAALREIAGRDATAPADPFGIARRAGADIALLAGIALTGDRLALEVRILDAAAAGELPLFRGAEPRSRAFSLAAAALRHTAAVSGLALGENGEALLSRPPAASLEAYAAYRIALLETVPAARIEKLRAALRLDPNYPEASLRLGVELYRQGEIAQALEVLERAVQLQPKEAAAYNNLGVALAASGSPELAQRRFERALELQPGYAEARLNLARVLEERGLEAEAERQYTALLEGDAGNDSARFGLAALYDRTQRPDQAIKEFRTLSARRPELAEGTFIEAGKEARKAREYPRAEKYFRRAADINPQSAAAWEELGTNSYLAGEYPAAAEHFRTALSLDPGRAALYYFLALALEKGGERQGAVSAYRRALELGGPPESRLGLARQALEEGEPAAAVDELNLLLASSPEHPEARALLARASADLESRRRLADVQGAFLAQRLARLERIVADTERTNRALEARLQSLEQEKGALEARLAADSATLAERGRALESARLAVRDLALELGRAALRARSWDLAVRYLEQAVGADPRSREGWAGLGEAFAGLGQPDRSRQMLLKAGTLE